MNYKEWLMTVPKEITGDYGKVKLIVWRCLLPSWVGTTFQKMMRDKRMHGLADQLYRALGSISANIVGGYFRGTGKGRALLYEYALGSARESRDWY